MEKTENSTPYSPRYGEAETGGTGRLKIFFGYAAGVGKTYAMLEAAHQAQKEGVDVVVGYVEPHARPDTLALLEGLEVLSCREVDYRGIRLREFDLDGALARRPQLILVDELAHSNAPGCRHTKRYQDVEELLQAGINVYTTVNVQHLESLNDLVTSITGIVVNERIPDHVFDRANQVELVDIAPADLEKRLEEGKIYRQRQAKQALENFFTAENLTALREIAMRRTADQLNRTAVQEKKGKAARAGDHIQSGDEYLLAQMDAHLIVQVIINIVDNAIKYTPPGSDIEISWERQGRFAALSVADNGPGIPDSAKPRVFDMFYSASNRIADSRRSMGLGLALCKSIITAHGGEITVADHAPHGTVFTFTIPIEEVELHE